MKLELHRFSDWSALYVDGVLDSTGHDVSERTYELAGVVVVDGDDSFMRGGNGTGRRGTAPVARTLAEIEEYRTERDQRQRRADELRAQAIELVRQADALTGKEAR